jgi:hypothetical protein
MSLSFNLRLILSRHLMSGISVSQLFTPDTNTRLPKVFSTVEPWIGLWRRLAVLRSQHIYGRVATVNIYLLLPVLQNCRNQLTQTLPANCTPPPPLRASFPISYLHFLGPKHSDLINRETRCLCSNIIIFKYSIAFRFTIINIYFTLCNEYHSVSSCLVLLISDWWICEANEVIVTLKKRLTSKTEH